MSKKYIHYNNNSDRAIFNINHNGGTGYIDLSSYNIYKLGYSCSPNGIGDKSPILEKEQVIYTQDNPHSTNIIKLTQYSTVYEIMQEEGEESFHFFRLTFPPCFFSNTASNDTVNFTLDLVIEEN